MFQILLFLLLLTLMASPLSDNDFLSNKQFAGLFQRLSTDEDARDVPSAAEVVDDYEGEQETFNLQSAFGGCSEDDADDDSESEDDAGDNGEEEGDEASAEFLRLQDVLKNASKGVTEGTDSEYLRSEHTNCPSFLLVCL